MNSPLLIAHRKLSKINNKVALYFDVNSSFGILVTLTFIYDFHLLIVSTTEYDEIDYRLLISSVTDILTP